MKKTYALSLRSSLVLLVLLTVIPAMVLISLQADRQYQAARQVAADHALQLALTAAVSYNQIIEGTRQLMLSLAELPAVQQHDGKACSRAAADVLRHQPRYIDLGVADASGHIFCAGFHQPSGITVKPSSINVADRTYFREALQTHAFAVGVYQIGRIVHQPTLDTAYPVLDTNNHVNSVIFVSLSVIWLTQELRQMGIPDGAEVALVDSAGRVVTSYPEPYQWIGKPVGSFPAVKTMLASFGTGTTEANGLDGTYRLYGYTPLAGPAHDRLYIMAGLPLAAAYAPVKAALLHGLLSIALAGLVALAVAWLSGNVLILRPIKDLLRVTGQLAAGRLDARTGMVHNRTELGQLAQAFDHMGNALQERETQITLLQSVTEAISVAERLPEAFEVALRKVCEATGWAIGQAFLATEDSDALLFSAGWYSMAPGLESFRQQSEILRIVPDDRSMTGITWHERRPVWVADLSQCRHLTRWEAAQAAGLKAAMAFPVMAEGKVVAIMEFFSFVTRPEDCHIKEVVQAIGLQIGTVVLRKQAEEKIHHLAFHDLLTNLPNRAWLEQRLRRLIDTQQDSRRPFALLNIDIGRLTEINNTLGYPTGDQIMLQVAHRLKSAPSVASCLVRLSGSVFSILLPDCGLVQARQEAARLLLEMEHPFTVADVPVEPTAFIGIALYPQHGNDPNLLIQRANVAMHLARKTDSAYAVYMPQIDPYSPRRLALLSEFRQAIRENQLILYVQPKARFSDHEAAGMEALVRWQHPTYGFIPPAEFVPYIEQTGLILPLTEWMLQQSLTFSHQLHQARLPLPIAVNLSARNLQDEDLIPLMKEIFPDWQQSDRLVELEVTESAVMEDPEKAIATLQKLSEMGFRLYIDDFGTGYSSLSYLKKMPFNALKIDQSFIREMNTDSDVLMIVRAISELGHNLGLTVVAEGVATELIWTTLADLGCDIAQGSYVSPPMPARDFLSWLHASSWRPRTVAPQ